MINELAPRSTSHAAQELTSYDLTFLIELW